jgi:hypothetical protein
MIYTFMHIKIQTREVACCCIVCIVKEFLWRNPDVVVKVRERSYYYHVYKKKEKKSSSSSGYIPTIENNEAQLSSSEYVHEVIGAFFTLVACLCVKNGRRRSVNIT